jgi:hypothetical protein
VVAIGCFFPKERPSSWLGSTAIVLLAIPTAAVGALMFFHQSTDRAAGTPAHFLLMIAVGGALLWLAARLRSRPLLGEPDKLRASAILLGGLAFVALLFAPILLAGAKVPVPVFYGYILLLVGGIMWLLRRRTSLPLNNVLLFGIGDDTLLALFGLAGAIGMGNIQRIVTCVGFILVFGALWMKLRKSAVYFRPVF